MTKLSELMPADELLADLPPARCDVCDVLIANELPYRRCRAGYCTVLINSCGHEFASFGPVGCPSCSPYRDPRLRALRVAYRRRTRGRARWGSR